MGRVIKFRAWGGDDFYEPILHCGKVFRSGRDFEDFVDCNDVVEQWTGLHDRNGVEIYEGDILSGIYCGDKEGPWVIEWTGDAYGWGMLGNVSIALEMSGAKVIGNIHENPELLEAKS